MSKEEFIAQYIVTFIATWTANEYEKSAHPHKYERLNNPPFEDAEFLAIKAWECKIKLR